MCPMLVGAMGRVVQIMASFVGDWLSTNKTTEALTLIALTAAAV
jgi:hypothetical protein